MTEYFHPRMEEICGTLPAGLGTAIEAQARTDQAALDRVVDRGRRVRTDGIFGFGTLWLVAGLRRWRRAPLRHRVETAHLERWLALAQSRRRRQTTISASRC